MRKALLLTVYLLIYACALSAIMADPIPQLTQATARLPALVPTVISDPNPKMNLGFGTSVALSADGKVLVVGAIGGLPDDQQANSGQAYVFMHGGQGWALAATLIPSDPNACERFGGEVAISGDATTIIVNCNQKTPGRVVGYVYINKQDGQGWQEITSLSLDEHSVSNYVPALSYDGRTIAYGIRQIADTSNGPIYVFRDNGTTYVTTSRVRPLPVDLDADAIRGYFALSEDGRYLAVPVVGAQRTRDNKTVASVYIIKLDATGHEQGRLRIPLPVLTGNRPDLATVGAAIGGTPPALTTFLSTLNYGPSSDVTTSNELVRILIDADNFTPLGFIKDTPKYAGAATLSPDGTQALAWYYPDWQPNSDQVALKVVGWTRGVWSLNASLLHAPFQDTNFSAMTISEPWPGNSAISNDGQTAVISSTDLPANSGLDVLVFSPKSSGSPPPTIAGSSATQSGSPFVAATANPAATIEPEASAEAVANPPERINENSTNGALIAIIVVLGCAALLFVLVWGRKRARQLKNFRAERMREQTEVSDDNHAKKQKRTRKN